jgi:membrane protein YqaA with SNARE-associated domain
MLRSVYNFIIRLAGGPYALPALVVLSIVEATFPCPPPETLLAPMVLARRDRAFLYAGLCTAGSVTGGCIGYLVGVLAAPWALSLLALTHHTAAFTAFQTAFQKVGVWIIIAKGVTPIPFMVVTLASGMTHLWFPAFVAAALVTRGGRFFLGAALLQHPAAQGFIEKYLNWLAIAGVVAIVVLLAVAFRLG